MNLREYIFAVDTYFPLLVIAFSCVNRGAAYKDSPLLSVM